MMRSVRKFLLPVLFLIGSAVSPAIAQTAQSTEAAASAAVPSRVLTAVSDERLIKLQGNTNAMARPEFDKGPLESTRMLQRIVLVLQRSPEQEAALAAFNERQYDPKSPDFHHWLHAEEFGRLYGPSDADMDQITSWLHSHGFSIDMVSKGRVSIQFTGTVEQVQSAFHVEMHNYLVNGEEHISNDRDPSIPAALAPVVKGIASLNNFFPKHYSHPGDYVKRDLKTGKYTVLDRQPVNDKLKMTTTPQFKASERGSKGGIQPEFGYVDPNTGYQREELSPYDVATIYNVLPLWNQSTPINGKGVKVAIVGLSDVATSDFNTYRSSFGLPAGTLTTLHSGSDPGLTDSQGENTEDTEMVSATAPGAQVVLVADVDNQTTNGLITAITYIVDNEVAPILTMSYGECELLNGSSQNSLYNSTFQQAATAGISSFVAAGDSGSAVCTRQDGTPPYADSYGLAVSGMASTPYVTAVGGTDLQWPLVEATHPISTYWNSTNDSHGASAKGYMPEMSWNDTCTNPLLLNVFSETSNEELCNDAIDGDPGLVEMASGSGGVSTIYAKPSWQTGVTGIPADGKRDLPDVSMFAAYGFQDSTGIPGSALLICQASDNSENSCDYSNPNQIIYQENGGTSAASPLTAGIMALVIQKTGATQGLANPVFYQLAAKENYSSCNSNTVAAGNSCVFNDTTSGSNAAVCFTGDTNCVTKTSGDQAGILSGYSATTGYDLTTGLGSFNVANLVNAWPTSGTAPVASLSPTSLTFPATTVGQPSSYQTVTLQNTGKATLNISSFAVTGTNASSYGIRDQTCGATLAASASCTFKVAFTPSASGTLTGAISITDNAAGSPQKVTLTGTGKSTSTTTVSLTPTTLTFAATTVGKTGSYQSVTLKNTGTATLNISSFAVTGTNASSYGIRDQTCGSTLAAAASCTFKVAFTPTAGGTLTGAISITDNATGSPQKVTLTGTGKSTTTTTVTLTPSSLTFAATTVGKTASYQSVTLKNTGSSTLTISSFAVTGTNASSYGIRDQTCGSTLAAAASCTFKVAFTPTATGTLTGAVSITENTSGSPDKVSLTGTGK
jgi:subtilase family serine protease